MIIAFLFLALLTTVTITNKKNDAAPTDQVLEFSRGDSMVIFLCILSAVFFQIVLPKIEIIAEHMLVVALVLGGAYLCVFVIVNNNRERKIQHEHEEIVKVYQSLADILGNVAPEDIDFANVPFTHQEDPKIHVINEIVIDTSVPGLKVNDNSIIYAQYSLNKYFPELQWTSEYDAPNRQLIYRGLPRPPMMARWPGSDYRPAGWIPLGLATETEELCWNIADEKDCGESSYISEDGAHATTKKMPSAPQCMVLGSPLDIYSTYVWTGEDDKRLCDVLEGDQVLSYEGDGKNGKLVLSRVERKTPVEDRPVLKILMRDMSGNDLTIRCTEDHGWPKVVEGDGYVMTRADALRPGDAIVGRPFDGLGLFYVQDVRNDGMAQVCCLTVDHPSHLFLVRGCNDDGDASKRLGYVFTKNTGGGKAIWLDQMVEITR